MAQDNHASIEVIGADANNLQDLNVTFPIGKITMVVGVSGSGKSSLLKQTLASEGAQRLQTYLGVDQSHLGEPDGRAFIGRLPPTVHVGQRAFRASSRTTVGTASGLISLLRRIFIGWSTPVSSVTSEPVMPPTAGTYADWIRRQHKGPVQIWSIPISMTATDGRRVALRLQALGFKEMIVRSATDKPDQWVRGRAVSLANFKGLNPSVRHLAEVKIGELKSPHDPSLTNLLELAFSAGEGRVFIGLPGHTLPALQGTDGPALDSRHHWVTPDDPAIYAAPDPHLLSFNSPEHHATGACQECKGLGRCTTLDLNALIGDKSKSMHEGAFSLWTEKNYKYVNIQHELIEGLRGLNGFDPDMPWRKLPASAQRLILDGSGSEMIVEREIGTGRKLSSPLRFEGFRAAILRRFDQKSKTSDRLAHLIGEGLCPVCDGTRWSASARALRFADHSIAELLDMNFMELEAAFSDRGKLQHLLSKKDQKETKPYFDQIHQLASSFIGAGLGHLSAARGLLDVSEGESRRLRLAAVFDGRHRGLCLLLDEPGRGLHDEDVDRLAKTLISLRGNHTLIINEHRRRLARAADHFIEIGPGAGGKGGRLVRSGSVPKTWGAQVEKLERKQLSIKPGHPQIKIIGCRVNNLNGVDVTIPLGRFVCISGVSGSGKSSFVRGVLVPALSSLLDADSENFRVEDGGWSNVIGIKGIKRLIALDQQVSTPSRRSTVATFLDLAELIRKHFAKQTGAKVAGLKAADFGFNAGNGRCQECLGIGEINTRGRWIMCPACAGLRLGATALSVRDQDGNLPHFLDTPISELKFSDEHYLAGFESLIRTIDELGVGHLSLGRRLDTISGGELQRLRIARELAHHDDEGLMFVLDEPAAGLHHEDVKRLLGVLDRIVGDGRNTVVVVEHNLDLISAADWVIEFGPGSGSAGGQIVASAPPAVIRTTNTATGRMLSAGLVQPRGKTVPVAAPPYTEMDSNDAEAVLRWLRRLLGEDVPPSSLSNYDHVLRPVVMLNRRELALIRPLDFGGLDRELAAFILDVEAQRVPSMESVITTWAKQPKACVRIHPLVHDMYVWGKRIPASTQRDRKKLQLAMGLKWESASAISDLRATGSCFDLPHTSTDSERRAVFEDALVLGGGYFELQLGDRTLCKFQTRLIDFNAGIVGPLNISSVDLLRNYESGCPACSGVGRIVMYDESLILGDIRCTVEDQSFLSPYAYDVLKGIYRSTIAPFFKRMIKEGLWAENTPFNRLSAEDRLVLFHGYWRRPGVGSFLKTPKSDAREVASWLRWDGLHAEIHRHVDRGDSVWAHKIRASAKDVTCPECRGSGLRGHGELIDFGGRSYSDWLRQGTIGELHKAIQGASALQSRAKFRKISLLSALRPIVKSLYDLKLCENLPEEKSLEFAKAIASVYTDMPIIES